AARLGLAVQPPTADGAKMPVADGVDPGTGRPTWKHRQARRPTVRPGGADRKRRRPGWWTGASPNSDCRSSSCHPAPDREPRHNPTKSAINIGECNVASRIVSASLDDGKPAPLGPGAGGEP